MKISIRKKSKKFPLKKRKMQKNFVYINEEVILMIDIMKELFKPRNFKLPLITYLSDVFFKYAFGRDNDPRCKKLRDFLIENIIGFVIEDLKVVNP